MSGADQALLRGSPSYAEVTERLSAPILERRAPWPWWAGFAAAALATLLLLQSAAYLVLKGTGLWGIDIPVAWGMAIVNFVWWIGIGHAGTFISAVLLLLKQDWRTSINRFAEAMTLFALACAGLFPILHLGRPWAFYFLLPYPDTMGLWPQFRSPLVWDLFAVLTYFSISLLFWYLGLLPDLAALRDRAERPGARRLFAALSLGWRGSLRHWMAYERLYLILAALATPLVVSVHSIVSMDFAAAIVPGWHSTLFPPYFVAGAIHSGFAMALALAIPLRRAFRLHGMITERHLSDMAKMLLATGWILALSYLTEIFMSWYGGNPFEGYLTWNRMTGPYRAVFWTMLALNVGSVQSLWWRPLRSNAPALFAIALAINAGMWLERYVIVITSLHRDYLPSSWGMFHPTAWDWAVLIGSCGLFLILFLSFTRLLPVVSMAEMKKLIHKSRAAEA